MLTCNREAFSKAFHTVSSAAAGAKSDKPILSNVRVRYRENDTVTLYATDMDVFISCDVVCMEVKRGTVPGVAEGHAGLQALHACPGSRWAAR